jgi:aminoglycoside phosphotransferase
MTEDQILNLEYFDYVLSKAVKEEDTVVLHADKCKMLLELLALLRK